MKYSFLLIALFMSCAQVFGQGVIEIRKSNSSSSTSDNEVKVVGSGPMTAPAPEKAKKEAKKATESKELDKSKIVVVYQYSCKTQDAEGNDITDSKKLVLQVGDKVNRCYSYQQYLKQFEPEKVADEMKYLEAIASEDYAVVPDVWTNYPEGKTTTREYIFPNLYEATGKKFDIEWNLLDETAEKYGYSCNAAECDFHGKKWKVYYTEEIPTTAGPWKLGGLPGLIVYAQDAEGINEFALETLENIVTPIQIDIEPTAVKVAEKKMIDFRNSVYADPKYMKDQFHYLPDYMSFIEDISVFKTGGDGGVILMNGGKFVMKQSQHVYQALELK